MGEQTSIDPFRELNRYDERDEKWPSSAVYEAPRRTGSNGWRKFHAARECGSSNVYYVEASSRATSERYEYDLRCWSCGHRIDEDEILFIGGQWYTVHGWQTYGKSLEDLFLPAERVLKLGPDPDQDELIHELTLGRIEREASVPSGFSFGIERDWSACEACEHDVPIRFDRCCRMCYDGPWSNRLTKTLEALSDSLRVRNDSYAYRLPTQLSPTEPGDAPSEGAILWRRHDCEGTSKLVEVTQRLEDVDSGHREYVLWDPTHTQRWQYREDDLESCFWATGLYNEEPKPVMDGRIGAVWDRVCCE